MLAEAFIPIKKQEIVELRKQKTTLKGVREQKNVSVPTISKILKRELGDSYNNYLCIENTPITPNLKKEVVKLRKQFISLKMISNRN